MLTIGLDVGGTSVKGVLMNEYGDILIYDRIEIVDEVSSWSGAVETLINSFRDSAMEEISYIGLSAPGLPDKDNRHIVHMPGRLQGIENFSWMNLVKRDVHVVNDAHAALLAEAYFGAARGLKDVLMITLGTGVGGGILINGKLHQGKFQRAGSIADMSLDSESSAISATKIPGSLEDAIGNASVEKRSNGKYLSTLDLVTAYLAEDKEATDVWLTSVRKLAVGISSLLNVLGPEAVVIGGGIAQADDALFKPLQEYVNQYDWQPGGEPTPILKAYFGEYAGAMGAACFAFRKNDIALMN
ncbi:MAG TPA: ROK family protein [Cyclobacteriaceae bacterium]|nr:ROK family protein [Cyclobacteriaceae bacterium]